jgi:hypothetical protein
MHHSLSLQLNGTFNTPHTMGPLLSLTPNKLNIPFISSLFLLNKLDKLDLIF